jgi:hypothetical protein
VIGRRRRTGKLQGHIMDDSSKAARILGASIWIIMAAVAIFISY